MGVAERREREKEQLRSQIVDAARDLLVERGLAALSMRAIAERIEYSPATIYLYFRDKDELVREVVHTGFEVMNRVVDREMSALGETATALAQYGAMGRAYARFAVENPAYFRVMFELPATTELHSHEPCDSERGGFESGVALVARAIEAGEFGQMDARHTTLMGWGVIHGLTTLYLSGRMRDQVGDPESFYELIESAMQSLYTGWRPQCGCKGDA